MNTDIVQSYFIAVKTDPHTYKKAMFDLRNKRYGMDFSFKKICDQRQAIFLKARNEQNQQVFGSWLSQIWVEKIRDDKTV